MKKRAVFDGVLLVLPPIQCLKPSTSTSKWQLPHHSRYAAPGQCVFLALHDSPWLYSRKPSISVGKPSLYHFISISAPYVPHTKYLLTFTPKKSAKCRFLPRRWNRVSSLRINRCPNPGGIRQLSTGSALPLCRSWSSGWSKRPPHLPHWTHWTPRTSLVAPDFHLFFPDEWDTLLITPEFRGRSFQCKLMFHRGNEHRFAAYLNARCIK